MIERHVVAGGVLGGIHLRRMLAAANALKAWASGRTALMTPAESSAPRPANAHDDELTESARSQPASGKPKPRKCVTANEANSTLLRLASENPVAIQGMRKPQLAEVVRMQTGKNCSRGTIGNTDYWKKYHARKGGPKVVTALDKDHYETLASDELTRDLAKQSREQVQKLIAASKLPKKEKAALSDLLELGKIDEAQAIEILKVKRAGGSK